MKKQVAQRCPITGKTVIVYRDCGPAKAEPRQTLNIASRDANGDVKISGGGKVPRRSTGSPS